VFCHHIKVCPKEGRFGLLFVKKGIKREGVKNKGVKRCKKFRD
jgi:hypothetical protein